MTSPNGLESIRVIADILGDVRRKGVRLWSVNGELHYKAPKGALSSEEIEKLRAARDQIVALLEKSAAGGADPPLERRQREHNARAPLTIAQLAHWRVNRLDERPHVRTVASATRLRGTLDLALFRQSLAEMYSRHEALRTRIVVVEGIPVQEISESSNSEFEVVNLTALDASAREVEVTRLIHQLILEPIRVTVGPLLSVRLARLRVDEHVLIVAIEHIISDAFSLNLLLRDLLTTYKQAVVGRAAHLPAVSVELADYALWQRSVHRSWLDKHGQYWSARLNGCQRSRFPSHEILATATGHGWATVPVNIGKDLKLELGAWCRLKRTTLVMSVFTAYVALVMRWCKASDMVIRYQTDGRFSPQIANTIGFFASMLNLRVELLDDDNFIDLNNRVVNEYCAAYEHHDLSYIDTLIPQPEFARNTCFNWVSLEPSGDIFNRRTVPDVITAEPVRFVNPLLESYEKDTEPMILLHESEDEIAGAVYFPLNRFSIEMMERFAGNLFVFIDALLRQPQRRVKDVVLQ